MFSAAALLVLAGMLGPATQAAQVDGEASLAPGDGLALSATPGPPSVGAGPRPVGGGGFGWMPVGFGGVPVGFGGVVVGGLLAGVSRLPRRRTDGVAGPAAGPPPDVLVVFIPGFGSPARGTFGYLQRELGLAEGQIVRFDWRSVDPGPDHVTASRRAGIRDAADVLHAYLFYLGREHPDRRIYLIGHSKGGALIAELLKRWDNEPETAESGVVGAALLDPPIGIEEEGKRHRLGSQLVFFDGLPNNGGYTATHCDWLIFCRDTRRHLGQQAGVDTLVIRNRDAVVTSLSDEPDGLRIYDLEDDGGRSALWRIWESGSVLDRVGEAHSSPLQHPAVAACLLAELHRGGACPWTAGPAHNVSEETG